MVNTSLHFQWHNLPDGATVTKMFGIYKDPGMDQPMGVEVLSMRLCRDVNLDKFFVLDVIKHPTAPHNLPFSIPAHEISDLHGLVEIPSSTRPPAPTLQDIADELINNLKLDRDRVIRGLSIASMPRQIYNQNCPEGCHDIRSGSGRGWYRVDTIRKTCTCIDSQVGNVCKHRIAVFLMNEHTRRLYDHIKKGAQQ